MIVTRTDRWFRSLWYYHGTALSRIRGRLALTTAVAVAVTYFDLEVARFRLDLTPLPFQLVGVALGIFLGFRNNSAYDRFWEARGLWGSLVNHSRSLTRQILTLVGPSPSENTPSESKKGATDEELAEIEAFQKRQVHRVIAFSHVLRLRLRDDRGLDELRRILPVDEVLALRSELSRPNALLHRIAEDFRAAWVRGWIHPFHLPALEASLVELSNVQGACERIHDTPTPFNYRVLIHQIVAIYCFSLPFGLVHTVQELTPVVVMIIAYAFFALDAVGEELDDPFGTDPNDLPLQAICDVLEVNLRQRIEETKRPDPVFPVRGQLV